MSLFISFRTLWFVFSILLFYGVSPHSQAQRLYDGRQKLDQVAAGVTSSYEIVNGTLWAWGRNNCGQLGDGSTTDRYAPVQVGSDNTWIHVVAGHFCTYGLKADGSLWSWGYNVYGQLGLGNYTQYNTPQRVGMDTWSYIAASEMAGHVMAIKEDGSLWGWGNNVTFQLGVTTIGTYVNTPVLVNSEKWSNAAVGGLSTLAIRADGTMWGWGEEDRGQLGNGEYPSDYGNGVRQVTSGRWITVLVTQEGGGGPGFHPLLFNPNGSVLAIRSDGTLWAWGYNNSDQLGAPSSTCTSCAPFQVSADSWIDIAGTGYESSMGIKADGSLWAWGANDFGQLGTGSYDYVIPMVQIGTGRNWTNIEGGGYHMIASKADGSTYTWGANSNGQIGNNTSSSTVHQMTPLAISLGVSRDSWKMLVTGEFHSVGIKSNGTLWAWGYNAYGQLGDGTTVDKNCPVQIGTDNDWVSVSAGFGHTLALKANGTLWAWGNNVYGQLGNNSTTSQTTPQQISSEAWVSIAAGYQHSIAIKANGRLYSWGINAYGQLGDNTTSQRNAPTLIGTDVWLMASGGKYHTVALNGMRHLYAWGSNGSGTLGNGNTTNQSAPQHIGTDTWIMVSAGLDYSCAIRNDGNLLAWGSNSNGRLGNGNTANQYTPVVIGSSSTYWRSCSASTYASTMAIRTDGSLYGWGNNSYGQLGTGNLAQQVSPVRIGTDNNWLSIDGGRYHSSAFKADRLYFWASGGNGYGQLGLSVTATNVFLSNAGATYATVPSNTTPYSNLNICPGNSTYLTVSGVGGYLTWYTVPTGGAPVSSGPYYSTPALSATTTYYVQSTAVCAAPNTRLPITVNVNAVPTVITTTPGSRVNPGTVVLGATASAGTLNWYAAATGGSALGTGSPFTTPSINRTTIYYVEAYDNGCPSFPRVPVTATILGNVISTGSYHTLFIKSDGTLWALGNNSYGQIGDGTNTNRISPVKVGISNDWVSVSAGQYSSLAIKSDGTLWAWGDNFYGQLGDGTTNNRNTPVQIGTSSWSVVATDYGHSIGIRDDGTLWTWGLNAYYQLGDGTTTDRTSPIQIGTASNWKSIDAGGYHCLAVKSDGTLWAWGLNSNGQLGDGTTTSRTSPVQIGSSTTWNNVLFGAGFYHSVAIKSDGTLWSWGVNSDGQLGDGTTTNRTSPVQIGSETSWVAFTSSDYNNSALRNNGTLWAWGDNTFGQLGDGTVTRRTSPVQIGSNTWINISGNYRFTMGMKSDRSLCGTGDNVYGQLNTGGTTSTTTYSCASVGLRTSDESKNEQLDNDFLVDIKVFPNPSTGVVTLRGKEEEEYKVIDQYGRVIYTVKLDQSNNYNKEIKLDNDGIYIILNSTHQSSQRLLIMK